MTPRKPILCWLASLATLTLTVSCRDAVLEPARTLVSAGEFMPAVASTDRPMRREREAAARIAKALARAMSDGDLRQHLKRDWAASDVKEQKLHFASYLSGRGGELIGQLMRNGSMSEAELHRDIASVRDLEFYMPVRAHRQSWNGEETPLVAVALTEEDPPIAFDSLGEPVILDRRFAPSAPVVVLAPVESDFGRQRIANLKGSAERSCRVRKDQTLSQAADSCRREAGVPRLANAEVPDSLEGIYVTQIEFTGDECGHECWLWGDPEYEMLIASNMLTGGSSSIQRCASDYSENGITAEEAPWHYDQNGRIWAGKVRILTRSDVELLESEGDGTFAITFWEDDDNPCVLVHGSTFNALVKGALSYGSGYLGTLLDIPAMRVIGILAGNITAVLTVIGATNGDDFIGVAVDRSQTSFSSNKNFAIVAAGMQLKGFAMIKPYSVNGVLPGPVATVSIAGPNSSFLPYNTGMQLTAYGIDTYDTPVPNRPITWSSSNPSVATITTDGFVSGVDPGGSTITATIDGVSATLALNVGFRTTMTGPAFMSPWQTGHWTVSIQGGAGPYTYQWFIDEEDAGTGTFLEATFTPSSQHNVRAEVVDANAYFGSTDPMFTVTVNSGTGPYCNPEDPSCHPCDPEVDPNCGEQRPAQLIDGKGAVLAAPGGLRKGSPSPVCRGRSCAVTPRALAPRSRTR